MATVFKTSLVTRMEIQTGLSKKGLGQSHQSGKFKGGCGYEPAPAEKDSDWLALGHMPFFEPISVVREIGDTLIGQPG